MLQAEHAESTASGPGAHQAGASALGLPEAHDTDGESLGLGFGVLGITASDERIHLVHRSEREAPISQILAMDATRLKPHALLVIARQRCMQHRQHHEVNK